MDYTAYSNPMSESVAADISLHHPQQVHQIGRPSEGYIIKSSNNVGVTTSANSYHYNHHPLGQQPQYDPHEAQQQHQLSIPSSSLIQIQQNVIGNHIYANQQVGNTQNERFQQNNIINNIRRPDELHSLYLESEDSNESSSEFEIEPEPELVIQSVSAMTYHNFCTKEIVTSTSVDTAEIEEQNKNPQVSSYSIESPTSNLTLSQETAIASNLSETGVEMELEFNQRWQNRCKALLELCWKSSDAEPFRFPVRQQDYSDYLHVIKTPMDLQTVKDDLDRNNFETPVEFSQDMQLIFSNGKIYFKEKKPKVYRMAVRLQSMFEPQMKIIYKDWKSQIKKLKQNMGKKTNDTTYRAKRLKKNTHLHYSSSDDDVNFDVTRCARMNYFNGFSSKSSIGNSKKVNVGRPSCKLGSRRSTVVSPKVSPALIARSWAVVRGEDSDTDGAEDFGEGHHHRLTIKPLKIKVKTKTGKRGPGRPRKITYQNDTNSKTEHYTICEKRKRGKPSRAHVSRSSYQIKKPRKSLSSEDEDFSPVSYYHKHEVKDKTVMFEKRTDGDIRTRGIKVSYAESGKSSSEDSEKGMVTAVPVKSRRGRPKGSSRGPGRPRGPGRRQHKELIPDKKSVYRGTGRPRGRPRKVITETLHTTAEKTVDEAETFNETTVVSSVEDSINDLLETTSNKSLDKETIEVSSSVESAENQNEEESMKQLLDKEIVFVPEVMKQYNAPEGLHESFTKEDINQDETNKKTFIDEPHLTQPNLTKLSNEDSDSPSESSYIRND